MVMADSSDRKRIRSRVTERYHRLVSRLLRVRLVRRTQMELWKLRIKQTKQILLNEINDDVA